MSEREERETETEKKRGDGRGGETHPSTVVVVRVLRTLPSAAYVVVVVCDNIAARGAGTTQL